jgi:hypothetical protein
VLADPLLPATPLNSENINPSNPGPTSISPSARRTACGFFGHYLGTDYEDSPFDSVTALGRRFRAHPSVNTLSINAPAAG